ncbi:MAG: hypothetical protein UZ01_01455 [Candidatus Brocadia sinica]|nr:MAG: hypothetical protein UZ01_01455 [Candidatus Brocadia sinica]
MKITKSVLLFSLLFFNVQTMQTMGSNDDLPKEIFRHWIHSYEEDTKEAKVFRPGDYNFPRARGRFGFEIKENGEFVQYGIGPTDRPAQISGYWKAEGKDKINVYFEDKESVSYAINIISCTEDVLMIKK